jgi:Tol biopolymer transport system component
MTSAAISIGIAAVYFGPSWSGDGGNTGRTLMAARSILLAVLAGIGVAGGLYLSRRAPAAVDTARLAWVADAHQFGPVGYRDPAGVISPDGRWIAYSEGRFLRVRAIDGGPILAVPPAEAQIRTIVWSPDSRRLLADGFMTPGGWAIYDHVEGTRRPLWSDHDPLKARLGDAGTTTTTAKVSELRQLAWSPAGRLIAGIVNGREGQELWTIVADGSAAQAERMPHRIAFPAWTPRGAIACITTIDGHPRLTIPCGGPVVHIDPDLDVYGPVAFAPDGGTVYTALANASGTVDLWAVPDGGGRARRLSSFSRDSYAPSVAADGRLLFKVQSYRTVVAAAPAGGGATRPLASFQSETPSWEPGGKLLGITYGSWRRVVDDANYPDIAQQTGIIPASAAEPATAPSAIVHASPSEDQALCWSPNGKWIAFHSHKDQSDDIWIRAARADAADAPRRISFLGRGAEVGWPRWSPDGKWLLFDGASPATHDSVAFVLGVDQEDGIVTRAAQAVAIRGLAGEVSHAEWLADSDHLAVLVKEGPGRHAIVTVARDGGDARVAHRFASEHDAPGLAVSPDGRQVAFIAPAPDGFFQLFRMPLAGGPAIAVTSDRSHKTQPAWSPDGSQLAFTVWSYDAQFWTLR